MVFRLFKRKKKEEEFPELPSVELPKFEETPSLPPPSAPTPTVPSAPAPPAPSVTPTPVPLTPPPSFEPVPSVEVRERGGVTLESIKRDIELLNAKIDSLRAEIGRLLEKLNYIERYLWRR